MSLKSEREILAEISAILLAKKQDEKVPS